jgi:hypothetical protein
MYKIGQVLWLISKTSNSIAPVQIVSKTTTENADGFATAHTIQTVEGQTACLEDTKADITVFETSASAEKHLIENAKRFIQALSMQAKEKATHFVEPAQTKPRLTAAKQIDPNVTQIVLKNGTKANVSMKVPEGFQA